jgi:DNA-binding CsgD family transcriptional regulator
LRGNVEDLWASLTPREREVLELVVGPSKDDPPPIKVAEAVSISPDTVRKHVERIMAKLREDSPGEAVPRRPAKNSFGRSSAKASSSPIGALDGSRALGAPEAAPIGHEPEIS